MATNKKTTPWFYISVCPLIKTNEIEGVNRVHFQCRVLSIMSSDTQGQQRWPIQGKNKQFWLTYGNYQVNLQAITVARSHLAFTIYSSLSILVQVNL